MTTGDDATGIVAQSVGGGGGVAVLMTVPLTDSSGGNAQSQTGLIPDSTLIPITIGGKDGAGGDGGEVTINSGSAITTTGKDAYGLLAQSIGGGGGLVIGTNNAPGALDTLFPEKDKDKGNGGTVDRQPLPERGHQRRRCGRGRRAKYRWWRWADRRPVGCLRRSPK